ncbi:hypothetical protein [Colwellia psychrerythraea]|uniref:PEP motif anchor domain protein n=1 Tax=Colwellia psychrerythraea TaxID=28229 RepID=A0A099KWB5_COLPS|nr:hypothetical protein [Colwellia psychrerythraea]KGJ94881.1 hypothetical protein GAB14E_2115 [Colwellia psychrerythraea]
MSRAIFSFIRKVCLVTALLGATNSQAGLIVVSGELIGATGVVISGLGTYDVSFEDGSCASVFSGCDTLSDFSFTSSDHVISAGRALLEQVFVDSEFGQFDSSPELIRGCEDGNKCIALIPNKFSPSWVFSQNIVNYSDNGTDKISFNSNLARDQSILDRSNSTFAVFTKVAQIPTPATALLFGSALFGLVSFKRKK